MPAGGSNVLQGSLSVQGNAISSAATGNEALGATAGAAGNRILIDDVTIAGTGTAATAANNSIHNGVGVTSNVNSDLAIVNSQGNIGVTTFAQTAGAQILAGVQSSKNSQVTLADNSITADATGNTASSAIASGKNAASFTGTAAVSNQQANSAAPLTAFLLPSVISAQTGESPGTGQTSGSSVTVSGNTSAATAQGNQITQSLAIQAATVALGNGNAVLTGGTNSDGRVSASGAATLTNLQGNYNGSGPAALNFGSQILLTASGGGAPVANNTLALTDNRQEAVALGSGATNTLTLSGNSVGTGAGIASVQMSDATSGAGAALFAPEARITVNGNLTGGSVALTDNLQRAIAYGNSATNTLGVSAGNLAAAPGPFLGAPASTVTVDVLSGLPFSNAAGALPTVTTAYGILNDQSVQGNIGSSATGSNTFAANVNGNVSGASVANSDNAFVAATYGNDAASGVTLGLNNVSGSNASIANVTNTQAVAGTNTVISAIAAGGIVARTTVTGTLSNGSVSSSDNAAQALAYGSRATGNTVKVTGNNIDTSGLSLAGATLTGNVLATTAAFSVQNAQSGQGTVSAQRSGGPEVQTTVTGAISNSKVDASGNTTLAGATSNSAVNGVSVDAVGVSTTTAVQNLQLTSAAVSSLTGQEGALLNNKDGVQVVLGGASIQNSQVAVDGNAAGGSATGNAAVNRIDVKGNTIAVGDGLPLAGATSLAGLAGAVGDHALSSIQLVTSPTISSKVAAAFGVDTAVGAVISGSTLSASGNTQSAKAVANTGSNAITLAATDVSARSALLSAQGSTAAVESRSFMQAFAPASVTGSSVKLSNNSNSALSVINDVDNKVAVAGGSSVASFVPAIILQGALPGNTAALGDQVLVNRQSAGTSATSTADTAIYNEDSLVPANAGLVNSSFTASGNSTSLGSSGQPRYQRCLADRRRIAVGQDCGAECAETSNATVAAQRQQRDQAHVDRPQRAHRQQRHARRQHHQRSRHRQRCHQQHRREEQHHRRQHAAPGRGRSRPGAVGDSDGRPRTGQRADGHRARVGHRDGHRGHRHGTGIHRRYLDAGRDEQRPEREGRGQHGAQQRDARGLQRWRALGAAVDAVGHRCGDGNVHAGAVCTGRIHRLDSAPLGQQQHGAGRDERRDQHAERERGQHPAAGRDGFGHAERDRQRRQRGGHRRPRAVEPPVGRIDRQQHGQYVDPQRRQRRTHAGADQRRAHHLGQQHLCRGHGQPRAPTPPRWRAARRRGPASASSMCRAARPE